MMNKILQKELSAHFKKISDRKEQLDKIEKSLNLEDTSFKDFEKEIEAEITKKIKEHLDKNKFDYKKGRNRFGDRIKLNIMDGCIEIREFKQHSFSHLDVLDSEKLNEFLPKGLIEARQIIVEKLKEIENVILEFKENLKLKKGIDIQYIDNNQIKKFKIKEITISFNCEEEHYSQNRHRYYYGNRVYKSRNEKFEIKLNDYSYMVDYSLYSDIVFNNILLLIENFVKHIQKIEKIKEKMKEELRFFVFNQINKMMILGELE